MAQDEMRLRLHLKRVKVLEFLVDDPFELKILVSDTRSVVRCPSCGHKTAKVHDTRDVVVRDIDFGGRATALIWRRRRFVCGRGEVHPGRTRPTAATRQRSRPSSTPSLASCGR